MIKGKNKKSQEEMVGFVLIVVLVAVIFLIILAITVRQDRTKKFSESEEVSQFLDAILEHTTSCSAYGSKYYNVEELIEKSRTNALCASGERASVVLRQTLANLTEISWRANKNRPIVGYKLDLFYKTREGERVPLLDPPIFKASTARSIGADKSLPNGVDITLEIFLTHLQ